MDYPLGGVVEVRERQWRTGVLIPILMDYPLGVVLESKNGTQYAVS